MKRNRVRVLGVLFFLLMCGFVCMPTAADAYTIGTIEFIGTDIVQNRDGIYAGLYKAKLDGVLISVMCDNVDTHIHSGQTWEVKVLNTYSDTKFGDADKYATAAYLFEQTFGQTDANILADINMAIWNIMSEFDITDYANAVALVKEARNNKIFDWSNIMRVLTPNPFEDGQEFLARVPEPSTMLLLGFGLVGLAAVGRKRFH